MNPSEIFSFEQFIIQTGLVGLGLLLALYAIIVPHFKDKIMSKQLKKYELTNKALTETIDKLKEDLENKKNQKKLNELAEDFRKYSEPPFWIIWGVLFTVIFLSLSSVIPLLHISGVRIPYLTPELALSVSQLFLVFGIISFVIICFKVFIELKEMLIGEFEDNKEKSRTILKEAKNLEKKIKENASHELLK